MSKRFTVPRNAQGLPCKFCTRHQKLCGHHAKKAASSATEALRKGEPILGLDPKSFTLDSLEDVSRLYNFALVNWLTGHVKTYELAALAKFGGEIRNHLEAIGASGATAYTISAELVGREEVIQLARAWEITPEELEEPEPSKLN